MIDYYDYFYTFVSLLNKSTPISKPFFKIRAVKSKVLLLQTLSPWHVEKLLLFCIVKCDFFCQIKFYLSKSALFFARCIAMRRRRLPPLTA